MTTVSLTRIDRRTGNVVHICDDKPVTTDEYHDSGAARRLRFDHVLDDKLIPCCQRKYRRMKS